MTIRLIISVEKRAGDWLLKTATDNNAIAVDDLTVTRSSAGFPIPDARLMHLWQGQPWEPMCTGEVDEPLGTARDNILLNNTRAQEIVSFGTYLALVVLGEHFDRALAASREGEEIDIEVRAESNDEMFQRLPWEMMVHQGKALAQFAARRVSICRGIAVTGAPKSPAKLSQPLSVLFVIGRQIDRMLRPWAEMMALLRYLKVRVGGANELQNANIKVIYLSEATPEDIQEAVAKTMPSVVHIASHGQLNADGRGTSLLLSQRKDPGDPGSRKLAEPYPCSAERLLDLLTHEDNVPSVVVLNACHTADVQDPVDQARQQEAQPSFAARLVAGGVEVAVGMADQVADRACQIFTVQFYRALVESKSLPQAAAHGRRAALLAYPDYDHSVEWVRPTLFLRQGSSGRLPLDQAPVSMTDIAGEFLREGFPTSLCDRYEFLEVYQDLLGLLAGQGQRCPVIAIPVHDEVGGVGKTRLLEEIAARSLHDGFLPVLLRNQGNVPIHPLTFAFQIASEIDKLREHLKRSIQLDERIEPSYSVQLAADAAGIDPNPQHPVEKSKAARRLREFLGGDLPPRQLSDVWGCLFSDLEDLVQAVRAKTGRTHRPLLLLDDLHEFGDLAFELLDKAGSVGLGSSEMTIPLFFTYMTGGGGGIGKRIEDQLKRRPDIRAVELKTFQETDEIEMVCRQLLLSGYKVVFTTDPRKRDEIPKGIQMITSEFEGRPKKFKCDAIVNYVNALTQMGYLVEADYESILGKES